MINTTAHGKALKVRFREGYDGRDVANFNVYLSPYDSWVGGVGDFDGTGAVITTNDYSCTVPAFPLAGIPDTLHPLPFSNANYSQGDYGTPTGTDSGPADLERTREGFFEIIGNGRGRRPVHGLAENASKRSRRSTAHRPGCAQVQNAWANGVLLDDESYFGFAAAVASARDFSGAAGNRRRCAGHVSYAYDATAIDGFQRCRATHRPGAR